MPISQGSVNLGNLVTRSEMNDEIERRVAPFNLSEFKCKEFELVNVVDITIDHERGYIPDYQLRDSDGCRISIAARHIDDQTLTISSVLPITGTLYVY
ncbi:hypothetical protein VPHD484_0012 [Vibrio phage D484]